MAGVRQCRGTPGSAGCDHATWLVAVIITMFAVCPACGGSNPTGPSDTPSPLNDQGPPPPSDPAATTLLAAVEMQHASVVGGSTLQGMVRLANEAMEGGVVVALSSDSQAATVPASVIVAAGATTATFTISTVDVPDEVTVSITAAVGAESRAARLTITEVRVATVTALDTTMGAGMESALRVQLDAPAAQEGTTVWLSSSDAAATVPASIIVPVGQTSAVASIHTHSVQGPVHVTVSARAGRQTRTATLTVWPVFLSFVGQVRDWVTQGQSRRIEAGPTHRFSGHHSFGTVYISIDPLDSMSIDRWSLIFGAGAGQPLVPGRYVTGGSPIDPSQPRLRFGGQSRGCGSSGEFEVLTALLSGDGTIVHFHATFKQLCESNFPADAPTTGEIRVTMLPRS